MEKRRVNIRGIIVKDGKLFAQRLKRETGTNDFWSVPGGGLDPDESLLDGLTREMIEETGVHPDIGRLLFVQQFRNSDKEYLEFFFEIKNADDYLSIDLARTTHGMIEVEQCGFIDPKSERILPAFLQTVNLAAYLDGQQPVLVDSEL